MLYDTLITGTFADSEDHNTYNTEQNIHIGYLVFLVKDQNLFHRVNTIGNIFTSGFATHENIMDGVHSMK